VLYGSDPFDGLTIGRDRLVARLLQVLLNLRLRLRSAYVIQSFDDQLVPAIVHAAGALRSAAGTLRELEGKPRVSSRESLERVVQELGEPRFIDAVTQIHAARESGILPPEVPRETVLSLIDLAGALHERALALRSTP
jgi:hypothetical protein